MEKNKVIILIPSLNEIKSLKKICYSLKKNGLKFIILDDCSTDGTEKWLKKNNINYLRNKKIIGYENNIKKGIDHVSKNKNIEQVITNFKPPIFWKDKEIVKQQMNYWSLEKINNMIENINEIELLIKKNSANSLNILSNFIISQSTTSNN